MVAACTCAASSARSTTATVAPLAANIAETAAPMPDAAPVTIATLPSSEKVRSIVGAGLAIGSSVWWAGLRLVGQGYRWWGRAQVQAGPGSSGASSSVMTATLAAEGEDGSKR